MGAPLRLRATERCLDRSLRAAILVPATKPKGGRHGHQGRAAPPAPRARAHAGGAGAQALHHPAGGESLGARRDHARDRHDQAHRARAGRPRGRAAGDARALLPELRHDVHRARPARARRQRRREPRLLPLVLRGGRLHLRDHDGRDDRGLRAAHGRGDGLDRGRERVAAGRGAAHPRALARRGGRAGREGRRVGYAPAK